MSKELIKLINDENWTVDTINGEYTVEAYNKQFPLSHPFSIYGRLYREETNPELKFFFLKKMHDILWPHDIDTWNDWSERRYKEYCEGYRIIVWASGASMGKSVDAAKLTVLEWTCDPKNTGAIVASTTIEALDARVYGYVIRYIKSMKIDLEYTIIRSKPKKVVFDVDDTIHSISALAAARGTDDDAIKNYIGRHPNRKLILILDECPDLNPIIQKALVNLESGGVNFQCLALGNSNSIFDLHGALATPKNGWKSIDPFKHSKWETEQKGGICLYFNPYDSPAIHEKDPEKKKKLKFLPTLEYIEEAKQKYNENSVEFWRMIMGFWKSDATDTSIINRAFLDTYNVDSSAEWSGLYPLTVCAGLDPAFSTGGDQCILRLAILGQTVDGQIVLDYKKESMLFKIPIMVGPKSPELQIADATLDLLSYYNCPINTICVDSNGQGRAIAEVIALRGKSLHAPIKIYSTKLAGSTGKSKSFDVVIKTVYELWFTFRNFIQSGQIRGLDFVTIQQLSTRQIKMEGRKVSLESKTEYKSRMAAINPLLARSPDEADAAALCLQSAIINYGFTPGQRKEVMPPQIGIIAEKGLALKELQKLEHAQQQKSKMINLSADFLGDIADIKIPFS